MDKLTVHMPVANQGHTDESTNPQQARLDYARVAPEAVRAQRGLETYIRGCGLEHSLLELVKVRASMINGCAYCVDMHTKDARLAGETEQRLYAVSVWHETPFFTPRERAALRWTDALTVIAREGVSDELFREVRSHFNEKELVDLTVVVITINGWNRLSVTFRTPVGGYVPGSSSGGAAASGSQPAAA
jgi:AhpD family alkylhydroperoxidase